MRISKTTIQIVIAATALFALSCGGMGCSTEARLKTADSEGIPASAGTPGDMQVYSTYNIGKPYRILGVVVSSADAGGDSKDAVDNLKEQAAALGANAIVGLSLEINEGFWQSAVRATGDAVRY